MKKIAFLIVLLFSFNTFSSCPLELTEVDLCAKLTWIDGPHLDKKSHFKVEFWDKFDESQARVTPSFDINIYAWMIMQNGHSHGGPKMTWNKTKEGVFEVKDARFFMHGMKGYWEVRIGLLEDKAEISMAASRVPLGSHD